LNTLVTPLAHALRTGPDRVAIIDGDLRRSYRELAHRCRKLAGMLAGLGVEPGERVAILSANSPQYLEVYLGVPAAGRVVVPLNTRHAEPELRYALEDSTTRVLLTDREVAGLADVVERVVSLPEEYESLLEAADPRPLGEGIDENTLAGLFYTGGTTGASKGVMLSHRNLIANTFHWMSLSPPSPDDVTLVMAPLFHAAGSNAVLANLWNGCTQIPLPVFDPGSALDIIAEHQVSVSLGVPTMLSAMAEEQIANPREVSTLRVLAHGGSPIASEVLRRVHQALPTTELIEVYGATELSPLATGLRHEEDLLDSPLARSCGKPLLGVEVEVVDDSGAPLPIGEVGEVVVRGPNVMQGYWNKPEQTAEVLRDGWYRSGDLGYFDSAAHLFLVDRAKDMIVSGGENVYGSEVEEVLHKHPAVLEAAVFGIPDAKWGEAVCAVVVPRHEVAPDDIIAFCRERLGGYKVPKRIDLSSEPLPKSGPGKVLKRQLREPYWRGHDRRVG
jgi:long-chain acyl-CoA synthetase